MHLTSVVLDHDVVAQIVLPMRTVPDTYAQMQTLAPPTQSQTVPSADTGGIFFMPGRVTVSAPPKVKSIFIVTTRYHYFYAVIVLRLQLFRSERDLGSMEEIVETTP